MSDTWFPISPSIEEVHKFTTVSPSNDTGPPKHQSGSLSECLRARNKTQQQRYYTKQGTQVAALDSSNQHADVDNGYVVKIMILIILIVCLPEHNNIIELQLRNTSLCGEFLVIARKHAWPAYLGDFAQT